MDSKPAIRAVIWDLGGVILRTEDYVPRQQLADKLGISPAELEKVVFDSDTAIQATLGQVTEIQHWASIADHFHLSEEGLTEFRELFWSGDRADLELMDLIKRLRKSFCTGLLSNAWDGARHIINHRYFLLEDAFDVAVFSAEVGLAKPDPQIYHFILQKLGVVAEEAVFIDDSIGNVEAARKVGLQTVHFRRSQVAMMELDRLLAR